MDSNGFDDSPPSDDQSGDRVLVRIAPIDRDGRQISRQDDVTQALEDRLGDIRRGLAAGTDAIKAGFADIAVPDGWTVNSVQATFGITLATEGSVIVSKASAEASFEIAITYQRAPKSE